MPADPPSPAVATQGDSFLDKFPDAPVVVEAFDNERATGLIFKWCRKGIGFGEIVLSVRKADGTLYVDRECMSPEFCAEIVKQAIEGVDDAST